MNLKLILIGTYTTTPHDALCGLMSHSSNQRTGYSMDNTIRHHERRNNLKVGMKLELCKVTQQNMLYTFRVDADLITDPHLKIKDLNLKISFNLKSKNIASPLVIISESSRDIKSGGGEQQRGDESQRSALPRAGHQQAEPGAQHVHLRLRRQVPRYLDTLGEIISHG